MGSPLGVTKRYLPLHALLHLQPCCKPVVVGRLSLASRIGFCFLQIQRRLTLREETRAALLLLLPVVLVDARCLPLPLFFFSMM